MNCQAMSSRQFLSTILSFVTVVGALNARTAVAGHEKAAEPAAAKSSEHAEQGEAKAETKIETDPSRPINGVSLGEYRIRSYYQVDAQKSTVRFTLYATVKGEHVRDVEALVEEHRQKLRDQVIMATRQSPLAVFQEPDLATFRRRVLVRLRRAVPDLTIEDLYVSDFDLVIKSL
jgi:hypothetical protein